MPRCSQTLCATPILVLPRLSLQLTETVHRLEGTTTLRGYSVGKDGSCHLGVSSDFKINVCISKDLFLSDGFMDLYVHDVMMW